MLPSLAAVAIAPIPSLTGLAQIPIQEQELAITSLSLMIINIR